MPRPLASRPVVLALALAAALLAAGCDGASSDDGKARYPHETGARCATEADSPADCEAAEELAEEVEAIGGVADVAYEFRSIDGEGINELVLLVTAADDAGRDELASAIGTGLTGLPGIDGDRDTSLAASRAGASVHLDGHEDPATAAALLVTAGDLSDHGQVDVGVEPDEIWVDLPPDSTDADLSAAVHDVAAARLPPSVEVVVSGSVSHLGGRGIDVDDAERWDALVAAAEPGTSIAVSGRDVTATIAGPTDIRPRDFTYEAYGDRWWPMVSAHLDLVRELGRGATYTVDTNWEQTEDGFDTILTAVAGPRAERPDRRGWNAAAEEHLDG